MITETKHLFTWFKRPTAIVFVITETQLRNEVEAEIMVRQMLDVIDEIGQRYVVIDFSNVRFFSSSFVGALLKLRKTLHVSHGDLLLSGMCVPLDEVMRVMRLNQVIRTFPNVESALAASTRSTPMAADHHNWDGGD